MAMLYSMSIYCSSGQHSYFLTCLSLVTLIMSHSECELATSTWKPIKYKLRLRRFHCRALFYVWYTIKVGHIKFGFSIQLPNCCETLCAITITTIVTTHNTRSIIRSNNLKTGITDSIAVWSQIQHISQVHPRPKS